MLISYYITIVVKMFKISKMIDAMDNIFSQDFSFDFNQ